YTGGTTITAGTLLAGNATGSATGFGPVAVNGGALGGGNGGGVRGSTNNGSASDPTIGTPTAAFVSGPVTVADGGAIAPGSSIGVLTVNGPVTFSSTTTGSALAIEISTTGNDVLVVGGGNHLNFNPTAGNVVNLNLTSLEPQANYTDPTYVYSV